MRPFSYTNWPGGFCKLAERFNFQSALLREIFFDLEEYVFDRVIIVIFLYSNNYISLTIRSSPV